jgi:dCMP deaminase
MKTKFVQAHMKVAEIYAQLSSAKRLKVGAVIVKNDTIIGIGYNGMPSGWDNECEDVELLEDGGQLLTTKKETIHAESNALCKVTKSTNSSEGADMFITHAPCLDCAKLIHQAGIKNVYFCNLYRDDIGLNFLKQCNIGVNHVEKNADA